MKVDSLAWSGRRWLASAFALGALSSVVWGCSSESTEFRKNPHNTGGASGESGTGAGGTEGTSGGSGGSAQGGKATGGQAGGGATQGGSAGAGRGGDGGSMGGRSGGTSGTSGSDSAGASDGGSDCGNPTMMGEATSYARAARSSGFSGTDQQYGELYNAACAGDEDCLAPCAEAGGSDEMCEVAVCVHSTTDYCLPATVWRNVTGIRSEGTDTADAAVLTLVADPYEDFLLVSDFRLEVPDDAEIDGITVTVRRAGGSSMEAVDGAVHLIKGGIMGQSDRARPTPWTGPDLTNVTYGGPTDLWNETWTPADVNSPNFGVALSALYTDTAGSGRAYVDIVYVTIHVRTCQ